MPACLLAIGQSLSSPPYDRATAGAAEGGRGAMKAVVLRAGVSRRVVDAIRNFLAVRRVAFTTANNARQRTGCP